jgi:pimeloyl-ACP methyl ester carboxylesterase
MTAKTLFLPGAGGSASFWRPVADRLGIEGQFFCWPGLGNEPPDPAVTSLDDLVAMVIEQIDGPVNLVAQSMGGVVAIRAALAKPQFIQKLVLAVTSGGLPLVDLKAADWRDDYYRSFPSAARWISAPDVDLSEEIKTIEAPALLLWGDSDPISPVAVGERLGRLLRKSELHVIAGAGHDLAQTHASVVAQLIGAHLVS